MLEESFDLMKVARRHIEEARFRRKQVPPHKAIANLGRAVVAATKALLAAKGVDPRLGGQYLLKEFQGRFIDTGELPETSLGILERAVKNVQANLMGDEGVESAFSEAETFVSDAHRLLVDKTLRWGQGQASAGNFSPPLPESGSKREDHFLNMNVILRDVEDAWLAPLEG